MQNIILQELEDLDGILIATNNLTASLDQENPRKPLSDFWLRLTFFLFSWPVKSRRKTFSHPNCNGKGMICNTREREYGDIFVILQLKPLLSR